MALSPQTQNLKNAIQYILKYKLNSVDFSELLLLIDRFNEDNQRWMLNFILNIFNDEEDSYTWMICRSEPDEYVSISQEILDILEGNICTSETIRHDANKKMLWQVYPLRE